jgi:hypothetical protein
VLSSSPPVLKSLLGNIFAIAPSRFAVKLTVAGTAKRSWPDGGSATCVSGVIEEKREGAYRWRK